MAGTRRRLMMGSVTAAAPLAYVASALLVSWGSAHIINTGPVADAFGDISRDNRRILVMEWIAEGITHISLGTLVVLATAIEGSSNPATHLVYRVVAAVALGSNLGDRAAILVRACAAIARLPGTRVEAASAIEETAPLGPVPQGPYLNQMARLETALGPWTLLELLLEVEAGEGRVRRVRWGPRTLDCDLVLYGRQRVDLPGLKVPHPEIANRPFWQRELEELGFTLGTAAGSLEGAG